MSKQLQAVQIDEDTVIYIEAVADVEVPDLSTGGAIASMGEEETWSRTGKGINDINPSAQLAKQFGAIETTIRSYTNHTLNAFRNFAAGEVQKVTLEFGVNVSGEGGVPYIATGTVGCNLKITVECAFPDRRAVPAAATLSAQHPRPLPPPVTSGRP